MVLAIIEKAQVYSKVNQRIQMYHDIFGMMNDEILPYPHYPDCYALSLNDQLIDQFQ